MNLDAILPASMASPLVGAPSAAINLPSFDFLQLLAASAPLPAADNSDLPAPVQRATLLVPPISQPAMIAFPPPPRVENGLEVPAVAANQALPGDRETPVSTATSLAIRTSGTVQLPAALPVPTPYRSQSDPPDETPCIEPTKADVAVGAAPTPLEPLPSPALVKALDAQSPAMRRESPRASGLSARPDDRQIAEVMPAIVIVPTGASAVPLPALPQAMAPATSTPEPIAAPSQVVAPDRSASVPVARSTGRNAADAPAEALPVPAVDTLRSRPDFPIATVAAILVEPTPDTILVVAAAHPAPTMPVIMRASKLHAPPATTPGVMITPVPRSFAEVAVADLVPLPAPLGVPAACSDSPVMPMPEPEQAFVDPLAPTLLQRLANPVLAKTTTAPVMASPLTVEPLVKAPIAAVPLPVLLEPQPFSNSPLLPILALQREDRPFENVVTRASDLPKQPGAAATGTVEAGPTIVGQTLPAVPVPPVERRRPERNEAVEVLAVASAGPSVVTIVNPAQRLDTPREAVLSATLSRDGAVPSPSPPELAVTTDRFGDVRIAVEGTATDVRVALGLASTTLLGTVDAQRLATGLSADLAATGVRLQSLDISGGDSASGGSPPEQREPAPQRPLPNVLSVPRTSDPPATLPRSDRYA